MRKTLGLFLLMSLFTFRLQAQEKVNVEATPLWTEEFNQGMEALKNRWDLVEGHNYSNNRYADHKASEKKNRFYLTLVKVYDPSKQSINLCLNKQHGLKYGKIVVRAKCPTAKGIWPAIWLRPTRGLKRTVSGEVDLMEWISCFKKNQFQANFHLWGNFNGKQNNHTQYPKKNTFSCDVSKWHVYSAEWDASKLIVRVDDKIVGTWYAKDYPVWPFDYTYELVLDVAYGDWGASCGFDTKKLPQTMQVDWVKYYQLKK
jgi:hypothetical protein